MILDTLNFVSDYMPSSSLFQKGIEFVRNFDPAMPDGRHVLDGNDLFAIVSTYETEESSQRRLEAHRAYADIQAVVSGEEACEWTPVEGLAVIEPFDAAKDVAFYTDPPEVTTLALTSGRLAIFYPQDAHKPNCRLRGVSTVRKIVVKVRL